MYCFKPTQTKRILLNVLLLFTVAGIALTSYWMVHNAPSPYHPLVLWRNFISGGDDTATASFIELQLLLERLQALSIKGNPDLIPIVDRLRTVIHSITSNQSLEQIVSTATKSSDSLDVCPEKYLGTKAGYMFFVTGWVTENCTNAKPIEKVITIVLNSLVYGDKEYISRLENLLSNIRISYPTVQIFIPNFQSDGLSKDALNTLSVVKADPLWSAGYLWNHLLKSVTTPYVFLGRDLDYFLNWTSRLERQIRVVSEIPLVEIAGGAIRNRTGHWQIDCYQSSMYNYILEYHSGYHSSRNECMYCDFISGPFVTRTQLFKNIPFDESLPSSLIFEDFFLNVKKDGYMTMNCPDVMHMSTDPFFNKTTTKDVWNPLIKKWELNRLILPSRKIFAYTCKESGLNCKGLSSRTNSYLIPPCCIEQFATAMKEFHHFCEENGLVYELEAGSALGLVKVSDYIPWDLDGDATFYIQNYTFLQTVKEKFRALGMSLSGFKYTNDAKTRGYFQFNTPDMYVEFWGELKMSKDLYAPEIFQNTPTRVKFHNMWIYGSISPGLLARNRYGHEILKHAHSWLQLGMKSSWESYTAGKFKKCQKSSHHACLDHFAADGNIQFQVPEPND